jgi:hypothetical protein
MNLFLSNRSFQKLIKLSSFVSAKMVSTDISSIAQFRYQHSDGLRQVFKGHKENPMFEIESNLNMPILEDGQVLVKVKAATICISDIHTVCGTRIEPTPRLVNCF